MTKIQMLQQFDYSALPPWAQLVLIILIVTLIALGVAQLFTDEPAANPEPIQTIWDKETDHD